MNEQTLTAKAMIEFSNKGYTLFRNVVGAGKMNNRFIKYGLEVGSCDLIGYSKKGEFVGVEIKTPGDILSQKQINFLNKIPVGFVYTVEGAKKWKLKL